MFLRGGLRVCRSRLVVGDSGSDELRSQQLFTQTLSCFLKKTEIKQAMQDRGRG
jgi:hypothetical protein